MPDQISDVPEKKSLERIYRKNAHIYEDVLRQFEHRIAKLFRDSPLRISVKTRVKSFESYYRKLLRRLGQSAGNTSAIRITDLLGMRIVYPFIEDLETVKKTLRDNVEIIESEEKNADQTFREFGYRSTHLIVRVPSHASVRFPCEEELVCEIQLLTLLQDAWAEVEHELVYKADFTPFDETLKRKLAALNATLTLSDIIFQEIRNYQNQLHVQLDKRRKIFLDRLQEERMDSEEVFDPMIPGKVDIRHLADNGTRNDIDHYLLEALYAHNALDFTRAIEMYTRIFELDPPMNIQSVIYIHRGMAYFTESRFDEALADFERALVCDPSNVRALNYRGLVNEAFGRHSEACEDFDASLKQNPFQYDALVGRAKVHLARGNFSEASEDAGAAVRLFPDSPEAVELLETVRERQKKTSGTPGPGARGTGPATGQAGSW